MRTGRKTACERSLQFSLRRNPDGLALVDIDPSQAGGPDWSCRTEVRRIESVTEVSDQDVQLRTFAASHTASRDKAYNVKSRGSIATIA